MTTGEGTGDDRARIAGTEFGMPPSYVADLEENLTDDVFVHAEKAPEQVGFSRRVNGHWAPVTYRMLAEQVTRLAAGMIDSGVQAGDRVALLSGTRFEWMLCDFAIWTAGCVTVPIYETSSAEQVDWILTDSGAVAAFVETPDHAKTVTQAQAGLPQLRDVWVIDSGGID
ncbi:MAG TPA: AMP-binding protein, partial [Dermatophilaceae bacterium]|nr:AMP-binding protein [Dermatophilaceae bacterium]